MSERLVGLVDLWDNPLPYGFILSRAHSYLVHRKDVDDGQRIEPGTLVDFAPRETDRGRRAATVTRIVSCPKCSSAWSRGGFSCRCGFSYDSGAPSSPRGARRATPRAMTVDP